MRDLTERGLRGPRMNGLAESYLTSTLFRQILGRIELTWHPT